MAYINIRNKVIIVFRHVFAEHEQNSFSELFLSIEVLCYIDADMLKIDPTVFARNLKLTQKYCHHQMNTTYNDMATVFRSFNPLINNRSIFEYKVECYDFYIEPDINYVN